MEDITYWTPNGGHRLVSDLLCLMYRANNEPPMRNRTRTRGRISDRFKTNWNNFKLYCRTTLPLALVILAENDPFDMVSIAAHTS